MPPGWSSPRTWTQTTTSLSARAEGSAPTTASASRGERSSCCPTRRDLAWRARASASMSCRREMSTCTTANAPSPIGTRRSPRSRLPSRPPGRPGCPSRLTPKPLPGGEPGYLAQGDRSSWTRSAPLLYAEEVRPNGGELWWRPTRRGITGWAATDIRPGRHNCLPTPPADIQSCPHASKTPGVRGQSPRLQTDGRRWP
jgi:hypothetical protein